MVRSSKSGSADAHSGFIPMDYHLRLSIGMKKITNLLRCIPLIQTGLDFLASLLGCNGTIHHTRADAPEFVFQIGLAARENLVGVADGGFTLLPPTEKFVGQRVIQCDLSIAQREEARQGIGIEGCKFFRSHPA